MVKYPDILVLFFLLLISCKPGNSDRASSESGNDHVAWQWGPFVKVDRLNPVLTPSDQLSFICPILDKEVFWEEKDVFNPAAVVRGDRIHLIYRAEDTTGKFAGTSRLGHAVSEDGLHFIKSEEPVFYPREDQMKKFEWEGGVEDPRLVENEEGIYFMTYTAWDGTTARLAIASSPDLKNWDKHGLVLDDYKNGRYRDLWSKSGAIVSRREGSRIIATKINGRYWMYWGDTNIYMATSENLIDWQPLENEKGELRIIFGPRKGYFDSDLVEPGPPPLLTEKGIFMIYNSKNDAETGDAGLPDGTYAAGQILFSTTDPTQVIDRSDEYFFKPEKTYEIKGQVGNVCFLEALVPFKGRWFLYYGTADSKIAAAIYNEQ